MSLTDFLVAYFVNILLFRESCTVVPFKANTQKQKDHLGAVGSINDTMKLTDTKKTVGISDLLGILGAWGREEAGGITVGVLGMPNVGKSSLINSLKRSAACHVGAKPGITRYTFVLNCCSLLQLSEHHIFILYIDHVSP